MNERALARQIQQLQAEVGELRRRLGNLPTRLAIGGSGSGSGTGLAGEGRFKVRTVIDDDGNVDWDYPRFTFPLTADGFV